MPAEHTPTTDWLGGWLGWLAGGLAGLADLVGGWLGGWVGGWASKLPNLKLSRPLTPLLLLLLPPGRTTMATEGFVLRHATTRLPLLGGRTFADLAAAQAAVNDEVAAGRLARASMEILSVHALHLGECRRL